MKIVLITGSSSGIGKESVKLFQKKGWAVAATMRNPEKELELNKLKNVKCFKLDVTKPNTIEKSIKDAIACWGKIDLVINNAGYGTKGLFEASNLDRAKELFDVNIFGLMNVIWGILPHFRSNKRGSIINISSQAGYLGVPLNSLYNSSKFAVEGLSESLLYELETINVSLKVVELGPINTKFLSSSIFFENSELTEYTNINNKVIPKMKKVLSSGDNAIIVAEEIFRAATDNKSKFRYQAGSVAKRSYILKKLLPYSVLRKLIKKHFNI